MATKKCPIGTKVESIIFPQKDFTISEARKWLKKHDFKFLKVDIEENTYRFRQEDPSHFTNMKTIPFGSSGIKAVIGCPKK